MGLALLSMVGPRLMKLDNPGGLVGAGGRMHWSASHVLLLSASRQGWVAAGTRYTHTACKSAYCHAAPVPSAASPSSGEILHCLKSFAGGVHARDALMDTAFKGIGGLPGAKVAKLQAAEAHKVRGWGVVVVWGKETQNIGKPEETAG
jgi:hypothetical protein